MCVVDAHGKIVGEDKIASGPEAMIAWFYPGSPHIAIAGRRRAQTRLRLNAGYRDHKLSTGRASNSNCNESLVSCLSRRVHSNMPSLFFSCCLQATRMMRARATKCLTPRNRIFHEFCIHRNCARSPG